MDESDFSCSTDFTLCRVLSIRLIGFKLPLNDEYIRTLYNIFLESGRDVYRLV